MKKIDESMPIRGQLNRKGYHFLLGCLGVSAWIFSFLVEDFVNTIDQQEKTTPGLHDNSYDEWIERLRMYSEKKRELQNARKFDDTVHQELIKEFGV